MSEEQKAMERTKKFIADYEKLLTQPALTRSAKERAEQDVAAMKVVLNIAVGEIV